MAEEIYYHSKNGVRIKPSAMTTWHLENALKQLEQKGETECAVYEVMRKELSSRKNIDGGTGSSPKASSS